MCVQALHTVQALPDLRVAGGHLGDARHSLRANAVLNPIQFLVANLAKNDAPESKLRLFVPLSLDRTYH